MSFDPVVILAGGVALFLVGMGMFMGRYASKQKPPPDKTQPVEINRVHTRQNHIEARLHALQVQSDHMRRREQ